MRLLETRCGGPVADLRRTSPLMRHERMERASSSVRRRTSPLMRHETRCGCPVAGRRGGWRGVSRFRGRRLHAVAGRIASCRGGALRRVGRWSPFPGPGKDFRAVVRKNIAVPEPEIRLQVVVGESAGYPLRMAVRFLFRNLSSVSGCGFREGTVPRPFPCRAAASRRFAGCGDDPFPEAPGPFPCRVPDCRSKALRDSIYELYKWSRS